MTGQSKKAKPPTPSTCLVCSRRIVDGRCPHCGYQPGGRVQLSETGASDRAVSVSPPRWRVTRGGCESGGEGDHPQDG